MNVSEAKGRLSAVAAAVIFLSVMAIPAVYGDISHPGPSFVSSPDEHAPLPEVVAVEIRECLGTTVDNSYTKYIPRETLLNLQDKLHAASDLQQKFELLQEYGLLHEGMSVAYIQRQYDAYIQQQRIASPFYDMMSENRTGSMLINLNCDVMCMGLTSLAFPLFIPGLGFALMSSAIPLPFSGIGAVFWLLAKIMLLAFLSPLVPMLTPFLGYTPLTVPFGVFWGPLAVIDTAGAMGNWSAALLLTGMVIGFFGIWVNALAFTFFVGHAWAVVVHAGPV